MNAMPEIALQPRDLQPEWPFLLSSLLLCAFLVWLLNIRARHLVAAQGRQVATLFVAIHTFLLLIYIFSNLVNVHFLPRQLWDFDEEWTVASINSTVQLLFLGIVCHACALDARKRSIAARLYWISLGAAFIAASLFELTTLHSSLIPQNPTFMTFALVLLVSSLYMLMKQRKCPDRLFSILLFLTGPCLWGAAYALDSVYTTEFRRHESLEETLEVLGVAAAIAGVAGLTNANQSPSRIGRRRILASVSLSVAVFSMLWLGEPVWKSTAVQKVIYMRTRRILAEVFDGAIALHSWTSVKFSPGRQRTIGVELIVNRPLTSDFGFTFQLLDQESGDPIASANKRSGIDAPNWNPFTLISNSRKATMHVPHDVPRDRAMWLALSFWQIDGDEFTPLPINSSGYTLLGDAHILLEEYVFPDPAEGLGHDEALALFANGFALQQASIPGRVRAGQSMDVEFLWSSSGDGKEDWTQFLHFAPQAGGSLWNVDQFPLGLRLPTRLWYAGLLSDEQWNLMVPPDLEAGTYHVFTGLYRLTDLQRLEVTLADGQQPDDRSIPLGSISIGN